MNTLERVILGVVVFILILCGSVIARAAPYTSPPQSLDTTFFAFENSISAAIWQQQDGTWFCLAGQWSNVINYINTWPKEQPGESTSQYMMRAVPQIASRDLTPEEIAVCQTLTDTNVVVDVWIVKQYRTKPDRPVKRIIDVDGTPTVDTGDTIGRIAYGSPCGIEVFSGTKAVWREVTLIYPDNTEVIGAAVCQKQ